MPPLIALPWIALDRRWVRALCVSFALLLASGFFVDRIYHFRLIWYFGVLIPFLLLFDWRDLAALFRSRVLCCAALYAVLVWLSLLWSPDDSPGALIGQGWRLICLLVFLVAAVALFRADPRFERIFLAVYGPAAAAAGLWAVAAFLAAGESGRLDGIGQLAFTIVVGEGYGLAALLVLRFALVHAGLPLLRGAYLLASAACLPVILLTMSRGPLLALCLAVACLIVLSAKSARRLALAVGVLALGLVSVGLFAGIDWQQLIERGDAHRLEIWSLYLGMAAERPWLGYGLADLPITLSDGQTFLHPHNALLAAQIYGGLPALLGLAGLFVYAGHVAWRLYRDRGDITMLPIILFVVVASQFSRSNLVANAGWEWLSFWLPFALIAGHELARRGIAGAGHWHLNPALALLKTALGRRAAS